MTHNHTSRLQSSIILLKSQMALADGQAGKQVGATCQDAQVQCPAQQGGPPV